MSVFVALFLIIGVSVANAVVLRWKRSRLTLPPGPKPWPILGNVPDIPTIRPWEKYRQWCYMYSKCPSLYLCNIPDASNYLDSDIISLRFPTQFTIVLGSVDAATDLLEKRSHLYSSRKHSVVLDLYTL